MNLDKEYKNNQRKIGAKARQDGENVKNQLTNILSCQDDNISIYSNILLNHLNIKTKDVISIHTKSHADGKIRCSKSDLKATITIQKDNRTIKIPKQISLKSTFSSTQLSVHSVNSFVENLKNKSILMPNNVRRFLDYFTNTETIKKYEENPKTIYSKSNSRKRFSLNEINDFNSLLYTETVLFFEQYAKEILEFLISQGSETNKENFAQLLSFCNKDLKNLIFIDISKLIQIAIQKSKKNHTFCLPGKEQKEAGITTLRLYDRLVSLQMKGSGKGSAYHNLQFKISGNFIKRWIKDGVFNEI